jgi:hypothetical protein
MEIAPYKAMCGRNILFPSNVFQGMQIPDNNQHLGIRIRAYFMGWCPKIREIFLDFASEV